MHCRNYPILIIVSSIAALLLLPASGVAQLRTTQTKDIEAPASGEKGSNEQTRQKLLDIENQLKALKQQPAHQPVVSQKTKAYLVVENSAKGVPTYQGRNSTHYFLTRLILVNQSQHPLKLVRSQIKAIVDGKAHQLAGLPKNLGYRTVMIGNKSQRLNNLKFEDEVLVQPGKQGSLWIVISNLPAGPRVPEIEFETTLNDQLVRLNVNRFELGKLHYHVQLMGPSQCLAELTITGELNTVNTGNLMQEIDRLTGQNIKRFVIHFPAENSLIDEAVEKWLPRAAVHIGTNTIVEPRFPAFPTMIRELHLSGPVFKDTKPQYSHIKITHATEEAAIHAALDSAMRVLSREMVSEQIRNGSPPIKVAALISGGRQLTNEELELVLELTAHSNPYVQEAALYALRYFGDPRALERLSKVAKQTPSPQFEMAIASLAESRFAKGQDVLLQLLKQHDPESQIIIIGIISQSPRPQWGAAIYNFLSSDNQKLREAAIKALVLNGHPQLFEVLADALKSSHVELREVAFQELIKRKDVESETLATNYVLVKLQDSAPSPEMLTFINRIKDPQAIPLLFRHLQESKLSSGLRISVIKTLASIGDQTVEEQFLNFFPKATASEKNLILASFQKMKSSHYFKLAAQAMNDSNSSVVTGAIAGLRSSSSNEAIEILQNALQKTDKSTTWNAIYTTLVSIGTPEARQTIMDARYRGKIVDKKSAAQTALKKIYQRSPGDSYYKKGENLLSAKNWDAAMGEYQTAISIDELLVPAYLGIVNAKIGLNQYEEALKYVDQGLSIDDMHARFYVAKGLIYSNQTKSAEALKLFQKAIEIDPQDPYSYIGLASHYTKLNQNEEAIAAYDSAIKFNPRNTEYYSLKIRLLRKLKRYHDALAVCDDILKWDPKSIYAFLTKAYIFQQLSQSEDAIAACDTAIEISPKYLPSYITKAQIFNESEQWDEALKVYDQIILKNSRYLDAYTGRGHTNLQKSDWKAAQKDFQKAFELNNKSSQAISGLAICMVYNHEEEKAIPFIEGHVKQFEQSGLFRYNAACVYGRALTNLRDETKTASVIKQIVAYQKKAIQHLSSANEYGFDDVEWMQKDPDLRELQELPAFKSLVQMIEKKLDPLNSKQVPAIQNQ